MLTQNFGYPPLQQSYIKSCLQDQQQDPRFPIPSLLLTTSQCTWTSQAHSHLSPEILSLLGSIIFNITQSGFYMQGGCKGITEALLSLFPPVPLLGMRGHCFLIQRLETSKAGQAKISRQERNMRR